MSLLMEVVEGATEPLDFGLTVRLYGATANTAIDVTGLTVQIVLKDGRNVLVKDTSSGISFTNSTAGLIRYSPSSNDFVAVKTPYRIRFRVTDGGGKTLYHPNTDEDLIAVNAV
jgi:hypothetical protein